MQTLTETLTGAKILLKTLEDNCVDTIFGYPGGIVLSIYDELFKQSNIKHYLVRHEQAAIHAAEGFARVSGKCGVSVVTSGPGATNIVTGLANAYLDGFPLVVITGQVSEELLHKNAFQEVDIIDITKSCTKKSFQVKHVKDLQDTINEAFKVAMEGRKGPVVVDITKNVFLEKYEYLNSDKKEQNNGLEHLKEVDIDDVLSKILNSKRPIVISGGGVVNSNASDELFKFIKSLNIPIVSTMMGLGTYPESDEHYLGMIGIFGQVAANLAIKESDLVFAIGTRFNDRISCCIKSDDMSKKLIHLDIEKSEISKIVPVVQGIVGDAKSVLAKMNDRLQIQKIKDYSLWRKYVEDLKLKNLKPLKRSPNIHSFEVMQCLANNTKLNKSIITTEVGQHQVWAARYLQFDEPRKFITSGGLGTMGFGFPAAIGASIAKEEPVVCIAGDGSFQMNLQELATCVDYNIPVKIFVLNNGYLGMVRQFQEKLCNERYFATKISNPDFVKLANSYGVKAVRVANLEELNSAIDIAYDEQGPFLVDILIEPMELL